jgi:ATP-dependent exoDNAse (exonuclease V) beta subunit
VTQSVDHLVREEALDPTCSFIVQAPAGSGKTALLIRRYLGLLARVREPEEIIAITFTRKAAAEMRSRVLQALDSASGPRPEDQHAAGLWEIASSARDNNGRRNWKLDCHPSRLRIQTIDSLCAYLTRQMPWVSGVGAPLEVVEDARPLYEAAAEATVRMVTLDNGQWSGAMALLLEHLDNRLPRAVGLLVDMLRFRDQWLRHISQPEGNDPGRRARLENVWQNQIGRDLETVRESFPADGMSELVDCAVYASSAARLRERGSAIVSWQDATTFPDGSLRDLPRWRGLRELLLTQDGSWRKRLDVNCGFPPGKGHTADMKKRMSELLKSLAAEERLRADLLRIGNLPDAVLDDHQWQVISALTTVLPTAAAQLQLLFGETGKVDFTEIGMRANRALGSFDSPGDLAMRLDHRISHLLVDEFQDTSVSHFQIIQSLTGGWQEGDGRTLFLVGDSMQSIYRFREAEVGLFLRVWEQGLSNIRLEPLMLSVNFRSDPEIISWVNRVFAVCFPRSSDISRGAVGYAPSTAYLPQSPQAGVRVHAFAGAERDQEAAMIPELVRDSWRIDADERIAILVRSRQVLREILPALDGAGIRYSGVDIKRLDWEAVVQDLLALTRALSYPADRVAWLGILRAPWCGLTLHDLYALVGDRPGDCVWDCVLDPDLTQRLSEDGRQRLDRFIGPVSKALEHRGRLPIWRAVENLWLLLGGPACAGGDSDENVQTYLDLLRNHGSRWESEGLEGFMKQISGYWAKSSDDPSGRLQIMTLHKAKGLEFDTVIIPGLHRQPRRGDSRLLLWEEQMHLDDQSLLFAPSTEIGADKDPHYQYLNRLHAEKDHFETLRLLYVGCTRARKRLHLLANVSQAENGGLEAPSANTLLSKLWPALSADFEEAAGEHYDVGESRLSAGRTLSRLPVDRKLPVLSSPVPTRAQQTGVEPPESIEYSWAGETARHAGVLVHAMLDRIARDGIGLWSEERLRNLSGTWQTELVRQGVPEDESKTASSRILEALRDVLDDERAGWIFSPGHRDARNEYGLTWDRPDGARHMRIDRTFTDEEGVRWIIDYKSSTHEGAGLERFLDSEQQRYRAQLDGYARAILAMEPGPIRLGLYFPMLTGWREWPFVEDVE